MGAQWTPGPWKAVRVADSEKSAGIWHIDTNHGIGGDIATVWHYGGHENDAHLIAAAPELYEALEALVDITKPARSEWLSEDAYQNAVKIHGQALAALSTARGEKEAA